MIRNGLLGMATVFLLAQNAYAEIDIDALIDQSPKNEEDLLIEKVLRADLVLLKNGKKIRLIGLKAPEAPRRKNVQRDDFGNVIEPPVTPVKTIEERAFEYAKSLFDDKHVRLEYDIENKDEDFNTYAYAFLPDGTFANAEILRQGFANLKLVPPNMKYAQILREAYKEAHNEQRGLQGE